MTSAETAAWVSAGAACVQVLGAIAAIWAAVHLARASAEREAEAQRRAEAREVEAQARADAREAEAERRAQAIEARAAEREWRATAERQAEVLRKTLAIIDRVEVSLRELAVHYLQRPHEGDVPPAREIDELRAQFEVVQAADDIGLSQWEEILAAARVLDQTPDERTRKADSHLINSRLVQRRESLLERRQRLARALTAVEEQLDAPNFAEP